MEDASPLLTDLYQINMIQAYLDHGDTDKAVFEFFARTLPPRRGFLLAAGLAQALDFLETFRFSDADISWLTSTGRFSQKLLDCLRQFRFSGDVHAMAEGTVFFAGEPILRVTAPLPQAQFIESRLINLLHFQSLVAAKAAQCVLAAPNKLLVDFGMRRARCRSRLGGGAGEPREKLLTCNIRYLIAGAMECCVRKLCSGRRLQLRGDRLARHRSGRMMIGRKHEIHGRNNEQCEQRAD